MSNLYARVRKEDVRTPRRDGWKIVLAAAILLIAVAGVVIALPLVYNFAVYPDFTGHLLKSEYYAHENDSLRAVIDGQQVHIGKDNIGEICVRLIQHPPEQLGFAEPKREAEFLLDFGDGSVLRLWTDKLRGGEEAVRFLFEGADGSRYHFLTNNTSISDLALHAQAFQEGNTPID